MWGYTLKTGSLDVCFRVDCGYSSEEEAMKAAKDYVGSAKGVVITTFQRKEDFYD